MENIEIWQTLLQAPAIVIVAFVAIYALKQMSGQNKLLADMADLVAQENKQNENLITRNQEISNRYAEASERMRVTSDAYMASFKETTQAFQVAVNDITAGIRSNFEEIKAARNDIETKTPELREAVEANANRVILNSAESFGKVLTGVEAIKVILNTIQVTLDTQATSSRNHEAMTEQIHKQLGAALVILNALEKPVREESAGDDNGATSSVPALPTPEVEVQE